MAKHLHQQVTELSKYVQKTARLLFAAHCTTENAKLKPVLGHMCVFMQGRCPKNVSKEARTKVQAGFRGG